MPDRGGGQGYAFSWGVRFTFCIYYWYDHLYLTQSAFIYYTCINKYSLKLARSCLMSNTPKPSGYSQHYMVYAIFIQVYIYIKIRMYVHMHVCECMHVYVCLDFLFLKPVLFSLSFDTETACGFSLLKWPNSVYSQSVGLGRAVLCCAWSRNPNSPKSVAAPRVPWGAAAGDPPALGSRAAAGKCLSGRRNGRSHPAPAQH